MALAVATPAELDLAAKFTLEEDRLSFSRLHVATGQSRADLTGSLTDLRAPTGKLQVKALVSARDAAYTFSLPLQPTGSATAEGTLSVYLGPSPDFTLDVFATARGLGYVRDRVNIKNATASGEVIWNPKGVALKNGTLNALDARFTGNVSLSTDLQFHLDGNYEGVKLSAAAGVLTDRKLPWDAMLDGGITLDTGKADVRASGYDVNDESPRGKRFARWPCIRAFRSGSGTLRFEDSRLSTGSTTVDFSGALGQSLEVRARTANLDDVLPALSLLNQTAPAFSRETEWRRNFCQRHDTWATRIAHASTVTCLSARPVSKGMRSIASPRRWTQARKKRRCAAWISPEACCKSKATRRSRPGMEASTTAQPLPR